MTTKQFSELTGVSVGYIRTLVCTSKITGRFIKSNNRNGGYWEIDNTSDNYKAVVKEKVSTIKIKNSPAWIYRRDAMGIECSESNNRRT